MKTVPESERIVLGYVRVSTGRQASEGHSREAQRAAIEGRVRADYPAAPLRILEDTASGGRRDRPGLREMEGLVRGRRVLAVYATDFDRLARSARDLLEFVDLCSDRGARVVVLSVGLDTGTLFGRFVAQVLGAVGELERGQVSERTRRVIAHRKAQGFINPGSRPYGWREGEGRQLVEVEEEQRWIRYCLAERARGRTWQDLSDQAGGLGIKSAQGRDWTPQGLRLVITRAGERLRALGPVGLPAGGKPGTP